MKVAAETAWHLTMLSPTSTHAGSARLEEMELTSDQNPIFKIFRLTFINKLNDTLTDNQNLQQLCLDHAEKPMNVYEVRSTPSAVKNERSLFLSLGLKKIGQNIQQGIKNLKLSKEARQLHLGKIFSRSGDQQIVCRELAIGLVSSCNRYFPINWDMGKAQILAENLAKIACLVILGIDSNSKKNLKQLIFDEIMLAEILNDYFDMTKLRPLQNTPPSAKGRVLVYAYKPLNKQNSTPSTSVSPVTSISTATDSASSHLNSKREEEVKPGCLACFC